MTLFFFTYPVGAGAAEIKSTEFGNSAIVNETEYQEYLDSLSDEEIQEVIEKEELLSNLSLQNDSSQYSSISDKISIPGNFTMYQQEIDTYCIPACIKSLLVYVNGSSPSQFAINASIKTSFSAIPKYVNARQDRCQYLLVNNPSAATLATSVYMDVTKYKVPAFLRLSGTTKDNWFYETPGHCVLANAIYSDKSKLQVADPLGGRVSGCPYFYEKKLSGIYKYITNLCY